MKGDHVGDHYVCGMDLFSSAKSFFFFLRKLLILYLLATTNLSCHLDKSQVQCEPMHGTLQLHCI